MEVMIEYMLVYFSRGQLIKLLDIANTTADDNGIRIQHVDDLAERLAEHFCQALDRGSRMFVFLGQTGYFFQCKRVAA